MDTTVFKQKAGPIAREELRENLHRQMRSSIEARATCELLEGEGYYYPTTLLTGVKPGMTACTEKTFDPGAVDSTEVMLDVANDTPHSLGASVWTATERDEEMTRKVESGQVSVDEVVKTDPCLPSGGMKCSGYGREFGPHDIKDVCQHPAGTCGTREEIGC